MVCQWSCVQAASKAAACSQECCHAMVLPMSPQHMLSCHGTPMSPQHMRTLEDQRTVGRLIIRQLSRLIMCPPRIQRNGGQLQGRAMNQVSSEYLLPHTILVLGLGSVFG